MTAQSYAKTKNGYHNLWEAARVRPEHQDEIKLIIARLTKASSHAQYETVAKEIGCPWWFVAIIHQRESDCNFKTHLHNGDSLRRRTVHVPEGRPITGNPPFIWFESAIDALKMKGLDKVPSWEIPRCLYEWERYNGWGYFGRIASPYIWSFTTLYTSGKYIADHQYDEDAVDKQCGAAAMLKTLIETGAVTP